MATASIPSISSDTIQFGTAVTVYTNRENASYTHYLNALLYTGRSVVESTLASNVAASVQWVPPMSLMEHIPNAASVRARIRCSTYDAKGGLVGLAFSDYFTINVPDSAKPIISSVTVEQVSNGVPDSWSLYVQGISQARIKTAASGQYGATIESYKVSRASAYAPPLPTMYGPDVTTGVLAEADLYPLTVLVTDSRGLVSTKSTSFEVVDYEPPKITDAKFERCLANGTPDDDGAYLKVSAQLSISSCKRKNSYTATVQYRVDIGTILYEYNPTKNELEFKVPVSFASGPDYVVDSGASGSWRYQKWASGVVELWGAHQVQAASSTAIGNGYYSSQFSIALPFGVAGAVVAGTASNICHVCNADVEGQAVVFRLSNYNGISTTMQYTVRLHIKGALT